jgi:hypothetical protein
MSPYSFLAALPALLGLAGFVLYQSLGAHRYGREITQRIVDKLRRESPAAGAFDERLKASQVERLLRGNQKMQRVVGQQDFQLLQQALRQQFVISLLSTSWRFHSAGIAFSFLRNRQMQKKI